MTQKKSKTIIVEETTAIPQIPVKKRQKTGKYRSKCRVLFDEKEYGKRYMVESVNSIIKRIFSGINMSRSTELQIKETKLKNTLYNIYRSNKNNGNYEKVGFLQSQNNRKK